jgi:hypothetical protein
MIPRWYKDTKNCIVEGFKYNRGLVDYAKR